MKSKSALSKPELNNSVAQKELDRAEKQFDQFKQEVDHLTLDRMNEAPKIESEQQTKLSSKELANANEIWLKPKRSIGPGTHPKTGEREKFNEKFRKDWEFAKEYVRFIAENKEIGGESINLWTKPFGGVNCEEWDVPVNKPVWGPRYLADRIKGCTYHRLIMTDRPVSEDHTGTFYGTMIAQNTINRLDAHPVNERKSVFMGASGF